jgi:hypothetical protein
MTETTTDQDIDAPTSFKFPAPEQKPLSQAKRSKTKTIDKQRPADWVSPPQPQKPEGKGKGRVPPFTENKVPEDVPNTLETAFAGDASSLRNIHESLEILVDGHIKEARGIMGRTILISSEDAHTISDVMFRAKHGIGGKFKRAQPWLSEWMLDKLQSLPSVKGQSRTQFVDSWQNSREERHQRQKQMDEERKRMMTGV